MREIFEFINNNAIIASLITLLITTTIQIIFRKSDRRYNEKREARKEKQKQFESKAEFIIDDNVIDSGSFPCIKLVMSDFKAEVTESRKNVEFYYPNDILKKEKYKHLIFYIKNIGNTDINELDICVTSQKNVMLSDVEKIETFVKNKYINYNYVYDRKIMKQGVIKIDIAYLENSKICSVFSSELELLFKDSYGNLYAQPFFIQQRNLYEPRLISFKEYNIYTRPDTAIECFKNPMMW